jgi:hypothetical protein
MRAFMASGITLATVLVLGLGVRADEEKVALDKVPQAVMETVKKRFPKGELIEAAKDTADGKTEYEVTVKLKGQKIDITLTPEGKLLGLEKEIALKDLPKVVAATLTQKHPKATYKIIEEVFKVRDGKEVLEYYEVLLVTADQKEAEVLILPDGKIKPAEKAK